MTAHEQQRMNKMRQNENAMYATLTVLGLSLVAMISLLVSMVTNSIAFDRNCEGFLKRAADSSSVETALVELTKATDYLEHNNITTGYTSVIYTTPDEDINFWYTNLVGAKKVLSDALQTENNSVVRSNALMKLRETLLDSTQKGDSVTMPSGISLYPNNAFYFWSFFAALFAMFGCFVSIKIIAD